MRKAPKGAGIKSVTAPWLCWVSHGGPGKFRDADALPRRDVEESGYYLP